MDFNQISQIISMLGFPIFACIAMAWYVKDTTNKHRDEVTKLNDQHANEMKEVTQAINNNTLALQKLCDKLDKEL